MCVPAERSRTESVERILRKEENTQLVRRHRLLVQGLIAQCVIIVGESKKHALEIAAEGRVHGHASRRSEGDRFRNLGSDEVRNKH